MSRKAKPGIFLILIAVALLVLLSNGRTATSQGMRVQQEIPGTVNHIEGSATGPIAAQNDYVYMAFTSKLVILNASDPTMPKRVGWFFLPRAILDVEVSGEQLYITAEDGFFYIFSVANPLQPILQSARRHVSGYFSTGNFQVAADEHYVYVTHFDQSGEERWITDIMDATTPMSPHVVGSYIGITGHTVAARGGYLYLAGAQGLEIVSMADPTQPTKVGSYTSLPDYSVVRNASFTENRAYLSLEHRFCTRVGCSDPSYDLIVLDVSNPAAPVPIGDPIALRFGNARPFFVKGNYVYFTSGVVMELSDPTAPGEPMLYPWNGWSGVLSESHLYLTWHEGLRIVEITNPPQLPEIGRYRTLGDAASLAAANQRLYLSAFTNHVLILDLTTPTVPVELGRYGHPEGSILEIEARDNYLYLLSSDVYGADPYRAHLRILDVSTPSAPVLKSEMPVSHGLPDYVQATEMTISGSYLYVLRGYNNLQIGGELVRFDISDPANPREVAHYTTSYVLRDMVVRDPYIYMVSQGFYPEVKTLLTILDASNPMSLAEAFSYDVENPVAGLTLHEGYAYLGGYGLETWDVRDPAAATRLDSKAVWASQVWEGLVQGKHLYAAAEGLHIFDLSDPTYPVYLNFDTVSSIGARKVVAQGEYVYVAAGQEGLFILHDPSVFAMTFHLYLPTALR